MEMLKKIFEKSDFLLLVLVVMCTNQFMPVCYLAGITSPRSCEIYIGFLQMCLLVLITLWVGWIVLFNGNARLFLISWRKTPLLFLFILLAVISYIWSVTPNITLVRAVSLICLFIIAGYFGSRFSVYDLVNFIAVTVGLMALVTLVLGVRFPELAIMSNSPYEGLWRGVFWHKIYLGAAMALGFPAYLVILFSSHEINSLLRKLMAGFMLIIGGVLAILSDSVSGLMVIALQLFLFVVVNAWLLWGDLVSKKGYVFLGVLLFIGIGFVLLNLDIFFGLFGRSANMTGRVPMWVHLMSAYVPERLLLGYGLSAFWYQPFQAEKVQSVVGWGYPVGVSDNGYMDILLALGFAGLLLLLGMLAGGLKRSLQFGIKARNLVHFFPFFVLIHISFINISMSNFLESESFIWFVLTITLFMFSSSGLAKVQPS